MWGKPILKIQPKTYSWENSIWGENSSKNKNFGKNSRKKLKFAL